MIDNAQLLQGILRTAQMGQTGISAVLERASTPALRQALKTQRKEYASLAQEALELARAKNYSIQAREPMTHRMAAWASRGQLMWGDKDSKIAGMMIQGNTRGMIKSLKNTRTCRDPDQAVAALAQKMLDTENANIRQMKGFL